MSEEITVSIFCMAYNHEEFIRDTLEGFVSQITEFNFEVLIHDDASTDKTAQIIQEYEKKYPKLIKPIYQSVNQYSQHINIFETFILPKVRGKYVAVCEGDDYWTSPEKLQKQVDVLNKHPEYSACTHCGMSLDYRTNKMVPFNPTDEDYIFDIKDLLVWGEKRFLTSSLVARVEYFDIPKEIRMPRVGDYPRAVYLATKGSIYYMKEPMSVYRFYTPGSWSCDNLKTIEKKVLVLDSKLNFLERFNLYTGKQYENKVLAAIRYVQFEKSYWHAEYKLIMEQYRDLVKIAGKRKKTMIYANYYFPRLCRTKFAKKVIAKRRGF